MGLPKYVLPISFIGSLTGCTILLNMPLWQGLAVGLLTPVVLYLIRDYMSGGRYQGKERIAGKTVIITGANTGIGKETARDLARRGGRIIMACRDLEKCEIARKEIVLETANRNIECRKLDLASFASIRAFAKMINSSESHVDILINNAGVMMCPKMLTEDGLELQIGVNHFGHFLLTFLLLDMLKASRPSRIINLSSIGHKKGKINFDDLNSANSYNRVDAYCQSKLANVLFTRELAKRLEGTGVTANSLHPGVVDTELYRHLPISSTYIANLLMAPVRLMGFKTSMEGAQTTIRLAVDPELESLSGKYFSDCKETEATKNAQDDEVARRLWAISEAWTRCKES